MGVPKGHARFLCSAGVEKSQGMKHTSVVQDAAFPHTWLKGSRAWSNFGTSCVHGLPLARKKKLELSQQPDGFEKTRANIQKSTNQIEVVPWDCCCKKGILRLMCMRLAYRVNFPGWVIFPARLFTQESASCGMSYHTTSAFCMPLTFDCHTGLMSRRIAYCFLLVMHVIRDVLESLICLRGRSQFWQVRLSSVRDTGCRRRWPVRIPCRRG